MNKQLLGPLVFLLLDSLCAVNAKTCLTCKEAKQQTDPGRIDVRTRNERGNGQKDKFYFVPEGRTFSVTNTTIAEESLSPSDRSGAPVDTTSTQVAAPPSPQ
jgi:hypothetical protein